MSNIPKGGRVLVEDGDAYRLVYYNHDSKHYSGHVVGYNRMIFDGQETNAFVANDFGTPQQTALAYPGISSILENL